MHPQWTRNLAVAVLIVGLLSVVLSSNAGAAVGWSERIDSFDGSVGTGPSLQLDDDGNPVVAYFQPEAMAINIARCVDRTCRKGGTINQVASIEDGNSWPSLQLNPNGHPVVAYFNESRVELLRCNDPTCAGGGDTIQTIGSEPGIIGFPSLALSPGGFPSVTYVTTDFQVRLVTCSTRTCSAHSSVIPIPGEETSTVPAVAFSPDGLPVIAYSAVDQSLWGSRLRLIECGTIACDGPRATVQGSLPIGDPVIHFNRQGAGEDRTFISGLTVGNGERNRFYVGQCSDADCSRISEGAGLHLGQRSPFVADMVWSPELGPIYAYLDYEVTGAVHVASRIKPEPNRVYSVGELERVMSPDPFTIGFMYPDIELHIDDSLTIAYVSFGGLKVTTCTDAGCIPTCNGLPVNVDTGVRGELGRPGPEDVVRGTVGPDEIKNGKVICGLSGDDVITPAKGGSVFAGAGNDTISLTRGKGFVSGGPGNDTITGSPGLDRLFGGPGNDTIYGRGGTDRVSGGDGNDVLFGGHGDDKVFGNLGRDVLDGGPGNDILKGGAWIDSVDGGEGDNDRCGIVAGETRVNCEAGVFGF